ncbi:hypothetical protein T4D_7450 [Trichinella pseudospiralis]|uniref:Uncharacterized protein n=1 Tax=Trichinella pseudospiralis TaxID=6337 RepID=A0A0V1C4B1_TRIPS|nr:hypothetical protein T4D_7450 [Trichinella pseudospiralis]
MKIKTAKLQSYIENHLSSGAMMVIVAKMPYQQH